MIFLHKHCLEEGIRAVFDRALGIRYGGKTVLYASITPQQQVHALFIQEFSTLHGALHNEQTIEILAVRWRDPLDMADKKELLEHELQEKPELAQKFKQWLLDEGWDTVSVESIPLAVRHREFSRAFPNRWEYFQEKWRQTLKAQETATFDWEGLFTELALKQITVSDKAPVCTVIQDVSM